MSNPVQSLTCRLDWREVFQTIGLGFPNRPDLPQSIPCPLCDQGVLTVMADHVLNSQWFHCGGCQFAGDVIEFSASVLKCPIGQTLNSLETQRLFATPLRDDDVTNYLHQHLYYRQRIQKFWEKARRAPAESSAVGTCGRLLLRRFVLHEFVYQDEWHRRGGQLFGIAQHHEVESLFAPKSFEIQERANRDDRSSRRRGGGPGNRRVFSGRDWEEVLIIAHSDLPGRIIGFTFFGRDVDQPEIVFKRVNLGSSSVRPRESGFGFFEAINGAPHPVLGRNVFIFLDPVLASLFHARHLRESARPLPLLLTRSSRDVRPLSLPPDLKDSKLIFCGPLMETLPLAKAHNALVSTYSVPELEVQENLKRRTPLDFLFLFQRKAIPWIEALRRLLNSAPSAQVDILLESLELSPRESESLQQGLGGPAGERFAAMEPHRLRGKQIVVGGYTIEETSEGWLARKPGMEQLVCDHPLRVESIYRSVDGNVGYGVVVHLPHETVHFVALECDLKRRTLFDIVADELRDRAYEHFSFVRHKWAKLSLSLALGFSDPQVIPHADRVGWNPARMRFQFPQFAILSGGDIDSTPMPIVREPFGMPALDLMSPAPSRQAITRLSRSEPETRVIWALAACVAHNVLAKNCTREPLGVILDGPLAHETGGSAARALGCGFVDHYDRRNQSVLRFVSGVCRAHNFPCLVDEGILSRPEISIAWIDDPHLRYAILPFSAATATAVALHHGFVRIRSYEDPIPLGTLASAAGWIIPSYLEDLCRRKKVIKFAVNQNEIISVLHDLASWFERVGGNPKVILEAEQLLFVDSAAPARALVELVEHLRSNNEISWFFGPNVGPTSQKAPIAVIESKADDSTIVPVQVRPWVINNVLRRKRVLAIPTQAIQADLESRSVLVGTSEGTDGITWQIDPVWWNQARSTVQRSLRPTSHFEKVPLDGLSELEDASEACPIFCESTS